MNVTIGVCTYNRAESLRRTLDSIRALRGLDPKHTEIVVVDNNSTDETQQVLADYRGLPLRTVSSRSRKGIGAARNRLLGEAHGQLLLQTDDDAVLDPGWLEAHTGSSSRTSGRGVLRRTGATTFRGSVAELDRSVEAGAGVFRRHRS